MHASQDILLRREDMVRAREALESAGFVHRRVESLGEAAAMDVFLDGPDVKVRDAVHVLWASEKGVAGRDRSDSAARRY